jgi:uncharacterized circularly permuted ATP-grasp superfamily protein
VLRDYGGNPAGLGYALENRIVISRVFPRLYHQTQIRRLAPFFHTFHNSLIQRASLRREDPGIVLLSPGPDSASTSSMPCSPATWAIRWWRARI